MAEYSMKEAIDRMLKESNWKYRYQVTKLKQDWEVLMGKTVAKHTKDLIIKERKLYIYTDIAPLKHELNYNKQLLVEKINQYFEDTFINEIIVV